MMSISCFMQRKTLFRLTAITRSQTSSESSASRLGGLLDTSIVECGVQPTECFDRLLERGLYVEPLGTSQIDGSTLPPKTLNLSDRLCKTFLGNVDGRHAAPALCEGDRRGAADPAPGPCDEGNFAGEIDSFGCQVIFHSPVSQG